MVRRPIRNPLLLPELFHHILNYLDAPNPVEARTERSIAGIRVHEPSRASREALFSLARTCHALTGPSLDRLWRALDSLVPLIRCFAEVADEDRALTIPSSVEWAIIRRYAVRVRELRIVEAPGTTLSLYFLRSTVPRSFLDWTNGGPLSFLPNLRVLVWNPSVDFYAAPLVEALLTPKLVSLDITWEGEVDKSRPLFEHFALRCPNIKALRWNFGHRLYEPILPAVNALSSSVLHLERVEGLEFFAPFDPMVLKGVILSPNFKVLGIMLDHISSAVEKIDIRAADTPFPNVETIELEIWRLDFLASLLRPHHQRFRSVVFTFHSRGFRPLVQPMLSCFTALATPQRMGSLQSITLSLHGHCFWEVAEDALELQGSPVKYCLTFETLSPLTAFRCLRKLCIALHNQISIDDDELATLARSWPSLEVLQLICRSGGWPWASAKYVTLHGLLALIEACPQLWTICLPIDARVVPTDASPDVCNTAIQRIEFPDSLISTPRLVAEFFHKHLPAVRAVSGVPEWGYALWEGDVEHLEECRRLWNEVEYLL